MGLYTMVLEGIGPHHNEKPHDADALFSKLAAMLKDAGHTVNSAVLHHGIGGRHDVIAAPTHLQHEEAEDECGLHVFARMAQGLTDGQPAQTQGESVDKQAPPPSHLPPNPEQSATE